VVVLGALVLATVALIALDHPTTKPAAMLPAAGRVSHQASTPRRGGAPPLPFGQQLSAVAATGAADVWVVGQDAMLGELRPKSMVLHFDGSAWSRISVPNVRGLVDVAAVARGDVWAIGRGHRVLHMTDGTWRVVRLPHVRGTQLTAVAGSGPDDVWIVGARWGRHYARHSVGNDTLSLHFDGTTWSLVASPNYSVRVNNIDDVVALSPTNAWATAESGLTKYTLHWNGVAWHRVDLPPLAAGGSAIAGVGLVAGNEVWVVGSSGGIGFGKSLYLRWTGTRWQHYAGPSAGNNGTPSTIGGVGDNDMWAIGNPNQSDSSIHRFDGHRWRYDNRVEASGMPFWQLNFSDLAVVASDDAWIVGYSQGSPPPDNRNVPQEALVVHWNGHAWERVDLNACCEAVSVG
jgi:hypothetical protein